MARLSGRRPIGAGGLLAVATLVLSVLSVTWAPTPAESAAGSLARTGSGSAGAPGIGDSYFPQDGNGGYDVKRYEVHDRYYFDTARLSGWTAVTLTPTKALSAFDLDFLLHVSAVRVGGQRASYARPSPHELRVTPPATLPAGVPVTVVVRYDDHPRRHVYAGESNWLADAQEAVAMNQPHMAPWWFPSNDHPLDKAVVDLHITVPRGNQVIGNGLLRGHTSTGQTTTWHWRSAQPMVPYLAFFAAGHFTIAKGTQAGRPWLVAVSNRLSPAGRTSAMTLMKTTPAVVDWLVGELGPYPFDATGGVVTSLNPGFALENQTRPVYPPVGAGETYLLVHELAHQWYGDDVAVAHWRDIWLNEGFASYLEWRYAETHGGVTTDQKLHDVYDSYGAGSGMWNVVVADPGAAHIFDAAIYDRGAMTLAALRNRIGAADFATVLRNWAANHRHGNGSDGQFRALATQVSGQDLSTFFAAWLDQPDKPAATADNGL